MQQNQSSIQHKQYPFNTAKETGKKKGKIKKQIQYCIKFNKITLHIHLKSKTVIQQNYIE